MKSSLFKLISLSAFSTIAIGSIQAGYEDRIDHLEKQMQEISARNPQDTLGASFTTARPEVDGTRWFATFDLTYWHAKMGGTEYAYSVQNGGTNTGLPLDGDTKDNSFSWDIGLKAGLGYKTPHDKWDLYARYTWYETENSASSHKAAPSTLISLNLYFRLTSNVAKSHINIDYNNVELELGRSYFISRRLSFRPHIDMKAAWIDINTNVVYTASGVASPGAAFAGLDIKAKEHLKFWGLGPRAGFDTKWYLGYDFHIFGDVAASVLYGYFNTIQKNVFPPHTAPAIIPEGVAYKVRDKFHRFVPFVQMFLGLGWERYINDEKQHFGLKLGYEVQYYWRVNQIHQPEDFLLDSSQNGSIGFKFQKQAEDLMFYGITGEIRLDF